MVHNTVKESLGIYSITRVLL